MTSGVDTFQQHRIIGAVDLGMLDPGEHKRIDVAFSVHRDTTLSNLENVSLMYSELDSLRSYYEYFLKNCKNTTNTDLAISEEFDVAVYPNPTTGEVTLSTISSRSCKYQLHDITGKAMTSGEFEGKVRLDLSDIPPGIYVLSIYNPLRQLHVAKKVVRLGVGK